MLCDFVVMFRPQTRKNAVKMRGYAVKPHMQPAFVGPSRGRQSRMQPHSMRSCSDSGMAGAPPVPPCTGDPRPVWLPAPKNFMIFFGTATIREADPMRIPNSITPDKLLSWIERTAEEGAVNPKTLKLRPNSSSVSEATYYPETLTLTVKFAGRRDKTYVYRNQRRPMIA